MICEVLWSIIFFLLQDFVHSSVGRLIDLHVVGADSGLGSALVELGRCETWVTRYARGQQCDDSTDLPPPGPGSALHQLMVEPDALTLERLTPDVFSVGKLRHIL